MGDRDKDVQSDGRRPGMSPTPALDCPCHDLLDGIGGYDKQDDFLRGRTTTVKSSSAPWQLTRHCRGLRIER